jgi:hypothetical protein
MPAMRRTSTITLGTSVAFFTGDPFELPQRPLLCNAGMTGQVTGLVLAVTIGSRLLQVESPVDILANLYPRIPDEMPLTYVAMPNERQVFQVRNTTAADIIARGVVLMQDA